MVEYTVNLDTVFGSLGDATRRDILKRVLGRPCSVGELAKAHKKLTFAAVAKHVGVLHDAQLVTKRREGRRQIVSANPKTISAATSYLEALEKTWNTRFSTLENLLQE